MEDSRTIPLINQNFYANLFVDAVMNSLLGLRLVYEMTEEMCLLDPASKLKDKIVHRFTSDHVFSNPDL